jgi:hypothetical protein
MDRARGRGQQRLLVLGDEDAPFASQLGLLGCRLAELALVAIVAPRQRSTTL